MSDLAYFKEKLVSLKNELEQRIHKIDKDMRHEGMSADWEEQATERENDEVLEFIGNASENEVAQINAALERIENGHYFTCQECGKDIPIARLEAVPYSIYCVDCSEHKDA